MTRSQMVKLPADMTSFVGRKADLSKMRQLLSSTRLVTLTGLGGVGKTRLSLKVAATLWRSFQDGTCLVELGELRDPELLVHTVAGTLGIRELSGDSPLPELCDFLADRHLLLLLDNCEHLLDACAVFVENILKACPDLHILATSREPLGIMGESIWPVSALSVPERGSAPRLQDLSQYDAVTLFADRAAAVAPGFRISENNYRTVAAICRRLEGLPLAIELAAARIQILSAEQILERLTDRYMLLSTGRRGGPERQRGLQSCVEWSFELCSAEEKLLWTRLSVFPGSFGLDAVEGICATGQLSVEAVLDVLTGLVNKSIVIMEQCSTVARYRLLETLREFGLKKLQESEKLQESDNEAMLHSRHCAWYEQLLFRATNEWLDPQQEYWLTRLGHEHPNIRAALQFCVTEPGHADSALRMAVYPWRFYWWSPGLFSEGRRWLDQAIAHATEPNIPYAHALLLNSQLATVQGDLATGQSLFEEGWTVARRLGDAGTLARAHYARGHIAFWGISDLPHAIACYEEALTALSAVPDLNQRIETLLALVQASALAGDGERASTYDKELRAICEETGERRHRSHSLWGLGIAAWLCGDLDRATDLQRQSLRLKPGLQDAQGTALCLEALAFIAAAGHHEHRAATLLGAADTLWSGMGTSLAGFQPVFHHHEECVRRVRRALGEYAHNAAFSHGASWTAEEAVAYALEEAPKPTTPPEADASALLTPREHEVAVLAAQGLTNREIAKTLVISQRTAEAHVEHILAKLAFTSRAQIGTWLAEHY